MSAAASGMLLGMSIWGGGLAGLAVALPLAVFFCTPLMAMKVQEPTLRFALTLAAAISLATLMPETFTTFMGLIGPPPSVDDPIFGKLNRNIAELIDMFLTWGSKYGFICAAIAGISLYMNSRKAESRPTVKN